MRGYEVDIIEILSKKFGFTFYLTEQSSWGMTGTVGAVKNMTSLIGIGTLKMTHQVYTVVDFLGPLGGYETRIAQRKPRAIKPYWASHLDIVSIV